MKLLFLFCLAGWCNTFAPSEQILSERRDCNNVPGLNKQVVEFVRTKINKKVGRGECWDLASEALNAAGANWDHQYGFGKEVQPSRDCVFPGDVMQFEDVTVKYHKDGYTYEEIMKRHTSVIYEVKNESSFIIAEQNTSLGGKKVSLNPLDLTNVVKGKVRIYRPSKD